MSHTPGPWWIEQHDPREYKIRFGNQNPATDRSVACMIPRIEDARLIAAAPELLEALREVAHELEVNGGDDDAFAGPTVKARRKMLAKAGAAIAKATGESE